MSVHHSENDHQEHQQHEHRRHKKHRVKINKWVHGALEVFEQMFESLEDAMTFTANKQRQHEAHATVGSTQEIKIYNEAGECVHSTSSAPDTYA